MVGQELESFGFQGKSDLASTFTAYWSNLAHESDTFELPG
jgi:hypothetical protein